MSFMQKWIFLVSSFGYQTIFILPKFIRLYPSVVNSHPFPFSLCQYLLSLHHLFLLGCRCFVHWNSKIKPAFFCWYIRVIRPWEFYLQFLAELDVNLSAHPASIIQSQVYIQISNVWKNHNLRLHIKFIHIINKENTKEVLENCKITMCFCLFLK